MIPSYPNEAPPQLGHQFPSDRSWQPMPRTSRTRRYRWAIAGLSVVLLGALAGGAWGFVNYWREREAGEIRTTLRQFALAADTADTAAMTALMCRAEAEEFRDGFQGMGNEGPIVPATRRAVDIGAIVVDGDDATAEVTRPPTTAVTFVLKREDGRWKLCNPG